MKMYYLPSDSQTHEQDDSIEENDKNSWSSQGPNVMAA